MAVRAVASELFEIDEAEISIDTVLLDIGAQSLDFVDLVLRLERLFKIRIPKQYAIPDTHTFRSIVSVVASQLSDHG